MEKAVKMAKENNAKLWIVHVSKIVIIEPTYDVGISSVIVPETGEQFEKKFEELMTYAKKNGVTEVYSRVYESTNVASSIVNETAEEIDYDLVICGSNNRHGLLEMFLGSVSSKLAGKIKTDIYIVKK